MHFVLVERFMEVIRDAIPALELEYLTEIAV
jgi:hypothetical protein